jgi:hypothetical protein
MRGAHSFGKKRVPNDCGQAGIVFQTVRRGQGAFGEWIHERPRNECVGSGFIGKWSAGFPRRSLHHRTRRKRVPAMKKAAGG